MYMMPACTLRHLASNIRHVTMKSNFLFCVPCVSLEMIVTISRLLARQAKYSSEAMTSLT